MIFNILKVVSLSESPNSFIFKPKKNVAYLEKWAQKNIVANLKIICELSPNFRKSEAMVLA